MAYPVYTAESESACHAHPDWSTARTRVADTTGSSHELQGSYGKHSISNCIDYYGCNREASTAVADSA